MNRIIKTTASILCGAALALGTLSAKADDTDIYYQTNTNLAGAPMVMFYLEYTPNMNSDVCPGGTTTTTVTRSTLQSVCGSLDANDAWGKLQPYFIDSDFADGKITQFELTRAALKRVLAPMKDVRVGLLLSHDAQNNCVGQQNSSRCSNGAYVLQGFTAMEAPRSGFNVDSPNLDLVTEDSTGHINNKGTIFEKLNDLPPPQGNLSHPNQDKEAYFELYRYLTGRLVYNTGNGWTDYGTDSTYPLGDPLDVYTLGGSTKTTQSLAPDANIIVKDNSNRPKFITPFRTGDDCTQVFVVNVVDGSGNAADDSDSAIKDTIANGGMGFPVRRGGKGFTQMVRWLYETDLANGTFGDAPVLEDTQNVTSFFIANQPQQLDEAAAAGGTGYALSLSSNPQTLLDTLDSVFNQILSVSTTFVSASIPVNVFNRSEVMDNVFIALFQTDPDRHARWVGNIKKLKLSVATLGTAPNTWQELVLVDQNGDPAISPTDGRINYSALTYWTNPAGWDLQLTKDNEVAGKDGRSVDRGGAGQRITKFLDPNDATIRGTQDLANATTGTRRLFAEPDTHTNGTPTALLDLDADATTASTLWPDLLGNASAWSGADNPPTSSTTWSQAASLYWRTATSETLQDEAQKVLKFIRGLDVKDDNSNSNTTESRRWLFGDPLHSKPLPINYGARGSYTIDNPDVRIVAGSNDGFVRMFRNTKSTTHTDPNDPTKQIPDQDGSEVWAFMPRSTMRMQKRLLDNGITNSHPYGIDGAPAVWINDANHNGTVDSGEQVWLFIGMRRGGHAYYALDISDPDNPQMLWSIDRNNSNFAELGMTFSTPRVKMLDWGQGPKPVLIFAGGYDSNKDTKGVVGTNDDEGNAIYIVDASNGNLVWKAVGPATGRSTTSSSTRFYAPAMVDSIPSDITAVDTTGDSLIDRFYVGDTGGVVWRGDIRGNDPSLWTVMPSMSVGRHYIEAAGGTPTVADDRRFFHAPDFVPAKDANGDYDAVVIGSGNRADPTSTAVDDRFYVYKDRYTVSGIPPNFTFYDGWFYDVTNNCVQQTCATGSYTLGDLYWGWKLPLPDPGEKVLSSPLTLTGTIYFSTYVPIASSGSCAPPEGTGYRYAIALEDAAAVFNYDTTNDVYDSTTGDTTQVLFAGDRRQKMLSGGIPSDPVFVRYGGITCTMSTDFRCQENNKQAAWRTYWYKREN